MSERTELSSCPCGDVFITPRLRADHHEWLLSVEDRGFQGAHELLGRCAYRRRCTKLGFSSNGHVVGSDGDCNRWRAQLSKHLGGISMKQALAATTPRVGMGRRWRAGVVAVAVSALTAALVATAAPASAASPSLTATSCMVDGGTYAAAKGVRTCTVKGPLVTSTVDNNYAEVDVAGGLMIGRWSEVRQTQVVTVQTLQKGKLTTTSSTAMVTKTVYPASCAYLDYTTFSQRLATYSECYDADVYPADIS